MFDNKTILVTGGTGFIGSRIIKHLLSNYNPKKVICYSRRWKDQEDLARELNDGRLRTISGDVCDYHLLGSAMRNVDYVFNCAAYKSVPSAEYSPIEATRVNVNGVVNVVRCAIDNSVQMVLHISTDKAVSSLNVYGAGKAVSERIIIAANNMGDTKFAIARYGNVFNSTGSVVPAFLDRINNDEPIVINDPDATRFWITEQDAVELVVWAMKNLQRGEIVVPDLKSSTIASLASAFKLVCPEAEIVVGTKRPGDKQHEMMISEHEASRVKWHDFHYIISPEYNMWTDEPARRVSANMTGDFNSFDNERYTVGELAKMIDSIN